MRYIMIKKGDKVTCKILNLLNIVIAEDPSMDKHFVGCEFTDEKGKHLVQLPYVTLSLKEEGKERV
ncbi:hypothetical protein JV173_01490 [Acholeplasma equirhinis]|uniref:hypothetical protein n=1 Tax=Acholeplasma equirhinis TaxID=555393 RepID=UPI00197AC6F2|nr:hypothetical protein [Acholeplasma equirhinis]MBN3490177.1 hypothetical protein [Acholeplasma equirhinis]